MDDIYKILKDLEINFEEYKHPAVFTVEEAEKCRGNIEGARIKNLFLRNKKGDRHYLLVADAFKKIDLSLVCQAIGEKKVSFASPERMKKYLGLAPGAVSPFGVINDRNKKVVILIDKDILTFAKLNFHPNINTATIQISKEDFLKFIKWAGNKIIEITI